MERRIVRDIHIVSNKLSRKSDRVMGGFSVDTFDCSCTHSQFALMGYLLKNADKEIFQKDIEENFGIRRSSVSAIISHLESKGLIVRSSVEGDARLKKISVTEKGKKFSDEAVSLITDFESKLLADVSDKELDIFYSVLNKLSDAVDKI